MDTDKKKELVFVVSTFILVIFVNKCFSMQVVIKTEFAVKPIRVNPCDPCK